MHVFATPFHPTSPEIILGRVDPIFARVTDRIAEMKDDTENGVWDELEHGDGLAENKGAERFEVVHLGWERERGRGGTQGTTMTEWETPSKKGQ